MTLKKDLQYVYRVGSDNQYRLYWDGSNWIYEFLAGGVLFDKQKAASEEGISDAIAYHGLTLNQFSVDKKGAAEAYSKEILEKKKKFDQLGIDPCPKHGMSAKNPDNTCEACDNIEYWDDHKGAEGS